MNKRVALILVLLLVVLGGAALLYQRQDRPDPGAGIGQALLKDLKVADVAAIRLTQGETALTLMRKDEAWTIAERADFPANLTTVREFLLKAIDLKAAYSEPIGEKDRARLNLDASGVRVEFQGADGKPLARMIVGKKYFKREPEDPAKAAADGRFVLLPEAPDRVHVVGDPLTQASAKTRDWIDRSAFRIEKVGTLEVRFPDGNGWRVERSGDNADWKLVGAKPGEKLDISRANAASYMLGQQELADVAAPGTKPEDSGLDKPTLVRAATLDGKRYELKVGKLAGEDYFVTFRGSGEDALEKRLQQHVLLIPKSKLEDTLKKRDEMLEKKEDAKK